MITSKHIRAAREILGWSQATLARRSGVAQPTLSNFEQDKTEHASMTTVSALQRSCEAEGIVFTAEGIEWKRGASYTLDGTDWWLRVLDDVYTQLLDVKGAELVLFGADDKLSSGEVNNRYRKLRNAGVRMRQFVCEGNTYLMGPVGEYRWVPKGRFVNNVMLVYGDRVGISAEGETKALIVKDRKLAESWRNLIEILWEALPQPEGSTAHERF